jgi:hypothetical protein
MKKSILFASLIITFFSCNKDNSNSDLNNPTNDCSVLPYRIGTIIKFKETENNRDTTTTTVFNIDTIVDGKKYIGVRNTTPDTDAGNSYFRVDQDGNFFFLNTNPSRDGTQDIELLFMKNNAPVGASWTWRDRFGHEHIFKIISTTEQFTFNNKNYTNGITIERTIKQNVETSVIQKNTYFCGIGFTSISTKQKNFMDDTWSTSNSSLVFYQY